MTKNNFYSAALRLRAIATAILTLTLVTFPARSNQPVNAQTPVQKTPSPARESKGGPKEGIKVHGHWTIEVRNPDGTLVKRQEFENALMANGAQTLSQILARQQTPGLWTLQYSGQNLQDHTCLNGTSPNECWLVETTDSVHSASFVFRTLVITSPTSGPNDRKLVLSGSATAQRAGNIHRVNTRTSTCDASVSPSNCGNGNTDDFTETTIPQPISVADGQIVQVTVVISFS